MHRTRAIENLFGSKNFLAGILAGRVDLIGRAISCCTCLVNDDAMFPPQIVIIPPQIGRDILNLIAKACIQICLIIRYCPPRNDFTVHTLPSRFCMQSIATSSSAPIDWPASCRVTCPSSQDRGSTLEQTGSSVGRKRRPGRPPQAVSGGFRGIGPISRPPSVVRVPLNPTTNSL